MKYALAPITDANLLEGAPLTSRRPNTHWSDEMLKRAQTKWIGGLSVNDMAADLSIEFRTNITRNMITGIVHRQGWNKKWPRTAPKNITESREKAAKEAARPKAVRNARAKPKKPDANSIRITPAATRYPDCIPDHVEVPKGDGYHFDRCQWPQVDPEKDGLRCEEKPVEGRPYCCNHARRAYTSFGTSEPSRPAFVKWVTRGDGLRQP